VVDYTLLDASDKCKELASHLHKSIIGKLMLQSECEKAGHYPKRISQANDTRWDSRCTNMEDVLYHKTCLMSLASQGKLKVKPKNGPVYSLIPSLEELRMIKAGVDILSIVKSTTKVMEQEKVPTMPLVTKRLYDMHAEMDSLINDDDCEEISKEFCEVLKQKFEERFPEYGTEIWLNSFGNYLNPSCKGIHLKLVNKFEITKENMENKLKAWKKEPETEDIQPSSVEMEEVVPAKKLSPLELLKQQIKEKEVREKRGARAGGRRRGEEVEPSALAKEMKLYEEIEDSEEGCNMLAWWKDHQDVLPLLSYLARVVLAIPAASSKSERVFSTAGLVVTPLRNRLDPEKVEDLLMIKLNKKLLQDMGHWKR
jgi:hypothetical protein